MDHILPMDYAKIYAESDDFVPACKAAGMVPATDSEERIVQARELILTDTLLVEVLSVKNN